MIATIVNCIAVIIGTAIGLLFARRIGETLSDAIAAAAGVVTLVIGFQMAFQTVNIIYLALALITGGILGFWWDIDGKILAIGHWLERRFMVRPSVKAARDALAGDEIPTAEKTSRFAYAFLNSSVLFCVGAMAIIGSFKAGTAGDYTTLLTKSVLDGFMAIVFAAAMGIGTAFSALSILVYQGLLTLTAVWVKPFVTERMLAELTGIGGAFIVMIGINLLALRRLKTANYLPGMLVLILLVLADPFIMRIAALFV